MTSFQYKRPPITEAAIEIRLENPLSREMVEKIHNRIRTKYDSSEQKSSLDFIFDAEKKELSKRHDIFMGFSLKSKDQTDILQIQPSAMICSRLAPYNGWENFEPWARENWRIWVRTSKRVKIQRIGVRYLNRIDIPFKKNGKIDVEDYLTVVPKCPEPQLLRLFSNYMMQIAGPFSVEGFNLIINTNVVRSPLIDHISIVLDLDLSPEGGMPQRNDQIWEMINQMRVHKNTAFEMCITDKARELFV